MTEYSGYGNGIMIEAGVAQDIIDGKIKKITITSSGRFINVVVDATVPTEYGFGMNGPLKREKTDDRETRL